MERDLKNAKRDKKKTNETNQNWENGWELLLQITRDSSTKDSIWEDKDITENINQVLFNENIKRKKIVINVFLYAKNKNGLKEKKTLEYNALAPYYN